MLDRSLPDISLMMVRRNIDLIPQYTFPIGYGFRFYQEGDEENWARIQVSDGEFSEKERAMKAFTHSFMKFPHMLNKRMVFVSDKNGEAVGTAAGWIDDMPLGNTIDPKIGRLHWVGIEEKHQGKGLARPMLTKAMNAMADAGCESAYLITQPPSYVAIRLYLQFGFEPVYTKTEENEIGWNSVKERVDWTW